MQNESDVTQEQWDRIQPLLPPPAHTGRPRADDRNTLNGVLYVLAHQCRWRDIPKRYGSHITCWRRHRAWAQDGTLKQILKILREDGGGRFDESWDEDADDGIRSVG
jgi:transposase